MAKYIDRMPPAETGDVKNDIRALTEYLNYLREQMNFILNLIYKQNTEER